MPGGIFLWLGISGVVTGLVALLWPMGIAIEVLVFGVLALVTIGIWLFYWRGRPVQSDRPLLNERAARLIGQEMLLNEPIRDGWGRVPIGDTHWRVSGPDLAAGVKVRVIGHDGAVLKVEAA